MPGVVELIGGLIASKASGGGSTPAPTTAAPTPAQTTATAEATKKNQEISLSNQFPNIQAATGGSLSPDAFIKLAELLSGTAGTPGIDASSQDLMMKIFGKGGSAVNVGTPTSGSTPGQGLTPAGSTFGG